MGCTHDLKFYGLAVKLDGPDLEVDADCGDVALGVGVVGESKQQAGLSDTRVTDEEELEQVVVSIARAVSGCRSRQGRQCQAG